MYHPETEPPMPVHEKDGCSCFRMFLIMALLCSGLGICVILAISNEIRRTKLLRTKKVGVELVSALKDYHNDNECWPMETMGMDWTGSTDRADWVAHLVGKAQLPTPPFAYRNYLDGFGSARKLPDGTWRDGIDAETDLLHPRILDPWGNVYRISVDVDGDGKLTNPQGGPPIPKRCLAWSAGPDGDFATWEDNVVSW